MLKATIKVLQIGNQEIKFSIKKNQIFFSLRKTKFSIRKNERILDAEATLKKRTPIELGLT